MSRGNLVAIAFLIVSILLVGCGSEEVEIPTSPRVGETLPTDVDRACVSLCQQIRSWELLALDTWYDYCLEHPVGAPEFNEERCNAEWDARLSMIMTEYLSCATLCDNDGGGGQPPEPDPVGPEDPDHPILVKKEKVP